jgi:hypothetical protein
MYLFPKKSDIIPKNESLKSKMKALIIILTDGKVHLRNCFYILEGEKRWINEIEKGSSRYYLVRL